MVYAVKLDKERAQELHYYLLGTREIDLKQKIKLPTVIDFTL